MGNILNKKPTLYDPKEWALIKSIYFEKDLPREEQVEPTERWERVQSKSRNNLISSR